MPGAHAKEMLQFQSEPHAPSGSLVPPFVSELEEADLVLTKSLHQSINVF